MSASFWQGKRVFITGHNGFKGSWLCKILTGYGADVTGYSLALPAEPNLFTLSCAGDSVTSVTGDLRDRAALSEAFQKAAPEIVLHLAAQPIVRESYRDPAYTFETNVMGTVNILECMRRYGGVKSFLNVTTDKVYENREWCWGYRESDPLDGYDPYSNSKSCSELVTHCYQNSFFPDMAVATARAGNVIGGGDFAKDRIIPDCIRAAIAGTAITVRNPHSIRPYQHVLEPLFAYLMIAQRQYEDPSLAGYYNVGPDDGDCVTTGTLVDLFCRAWGDGQTWESLTLQGEPHEANYLKLDCSKIKSVYQWKPKWNIQKAVEKTVVWAKTYQKGERIDSLMDLQIAEFLANGEHDSV